MRGRRLFAAFAWLVSAGPAALACSFHTELPAETLADRLLFADQLLLARSDPQDPFTFEVTGALRGPAVDLDIPLLVDTRTRQVLDRDPKAAVLFGRLDPYGPVERLVLLDARMRPVVTEILARSETWLYEGDEPRARYFAGLLDDPDRTLHRLALRELDRLPYATLRETVAIAKPERLRAALWRPSEAPLLPIRVLLLGLSDAPTDRAIVSQALARAANVPGARTLGAFGVAAVEQQGADGVHHLVDLAVRPGPLGATDRELLVEALAIQRAEGAPGIAASIDRAVARMLAERPALAGAVARQFGARALYEPADAVATARRVAGLTTAADAIAIASYLSMAAATAAPFPEGPFESVEDP